VLVGEWTTSNDRPSYRWVTSIVLRDLTPGAHYYFECEMDTLQGESFKSAINHFHMMPFLEIESTDSYRFVVASDLGRTDAMIRVSELISSSDPEFIVIGGDLAYDNGYPACYCTWDWIFSAFRYHLFRPDGALIPLLVAIGNHETQGDLTGIENVPFFLDYFPYSDGVNEPVSEEPYAWKERSLYHSHHFGELMTFVALDSGHVLSRSSQREWMDSTLQQAQSNPFRFAIYHSPLYPGRRSNESESVLEGRTQWGPLFDKNKLSIAFENHDHVYKRTYPIYADHISEEGTIYVGDGGWGIVPQQPKSDRWYIKRAAGGSNYFKYVSVSSTLTSVWAIQEGSSPLIDAFAISASPRI